MVKAEATEDEVGLEAAALYDKLFCSNSLVDDCCRKQSCYISAIGAFRLDMFKSLEPNLHMLL